jgi:hypothetical protein
MNALRARFAWLVALALLLAGCAVSFVAEYDKATEDRLIGAYERVSRFYGDLAETAPAQRGYDEFGPRFTDVATDLRVLLLRQRARAPATASPSRSSRRCWRTGSARASDTSASAPIPNAAQTHTPTACSRSIASSSRTSSARQSSPSGRRNDVASPAPAAEG